MWEDEDDEGVEVAIAGRNRLRKLRQTEEETVVSGMKLCNGTSCNQFACLVVNTLCV